MIVNPQFFNYRLIIVSLVIVLVTSTSFSLVSLGSLKSERQFLVKEKKLMEHELSETMSILLKMKKDKETLSTERDKAIFALDSMQAMQNPMFMRTSLNN